MRRTFIAPATTTRTHRAGTRRRSTAALAALALAVLAGSSLLALDPVRTYVDPSPSSGAHLGASVAGFAERVAFGAPYQNRDGHVRAGKVVVFDTPSRLHLWTFHNPFPGDDEDMFGASLAALGKNKLVVGTPNGAGDVGVVYVYNLDTGRRLLTIDNPDPDAGDQFGAAVGVVYPSTIIVGAPGEDAEGRNAGAAHLFNGSTGAYLRTIYADDAEASAYFGTAVAGNDYALVGAPGANGDVGQAYVIDPDNGDVVHRLANPSPAAGLGGDDRFGTAIAAVAGNVLVGAPGEDAPKMADAGAAYYFSGSTGALLRTIANPDPDADDTFGRSVVGKGFNRGVIGADGDDTEAQNAGAAYLVNLDTGVLLETYDDPAAVGGERCGAAVGLSSGSGFVVGCWWANGGRVGSGNAQLYQEAAGPEISVHYNLVSLRDGDSTAYSIGTTTVGATKTGTFAILNIGSARLNLTGTPRVQLSGTGASCFETGDPGASVESGAVATFGIRFAPVAAGTCKAKVTIRSNDASENPFDFNIKGVGVAP